MLSILLATYGAVLLAEIVGDKLLYTTGILATRYRPVPIMIGVSLAFMAKMAVAVAIGAAISQLPRGIVATVTAVSFLGVAYTLWRKPDKTPKEKRDDPAHMALLVSFSAVFFSEWGDVGQITAATMAARYHAPLIVWLGAVLAMITKGVLAAFLGAGVRTWIHERVSPRVIRFAGVGMLLVLGLLAVIETLTGGEFG